MMMIQQRVKEDENKWLNGVNAQTMQVKITIKI